MKTAVIDIGTNTTRLAVFEESGGVNMLVLEMNEITRLGDSLQRTGLLGEEAMDRTLAVLSRYLLEAGRAGVSHFIAAGTAAMRDARNRDEFLMRARGMGLDVRVLSGAREAELVFMGAAGGLDTLPDRAVVLDIGGGSVEIICAKKQSDPVVYSFPMGAVVMKEKFYIDDPPGESRRTDLREYCSGVLAESIAASDAVEPDICIGVAGTVTTLAMMDIGLDMYDAKRVHGHRLSIESVTRLADKLFSMNVSERKAIPGMQPGRADIIHSGADVLYVVMQTFGISEIMVSERDIRYGLLAVKLRELEGQAT